MLKIGYIPCDIQETQFIHSARGGSGLKIREMACDQKVAILKSSPAGKFWASKANV